MVLTLKQKKPNGIQLDNKSLQDIKEYANKGWFEWIKHNGNEIGFFTWWLTEIDGKQYIYIGNLMIEDKYRNKKNLLYLRKFFKQKYPNIDYAYWHKDDSNKFTYRRAI